MKKEKADLEGGGRGDIRSHYRAVRKSTITTA